MKASEERSRFLKKSGAKTSVKLGKGAETVRAQINKVFLLLFVHKK
jgi:hypothetical protein